MREKKYVDEETGKDIIEDWYNRAACTTLESLPKFIEELNNDYECDYGAYIHKVAACAIATSWACGKELSGFQASCVGLLYLSHWTYMHNKCGFSIVDYDDFLYPQYAQKVCTIPASSWQSIQDEANENVLEVITTGRSVNPKVFEHWQSIIDGKVPFGFSVAE